MSEEMFEAIAEHDLERLAAVLSHANDPNVTRKEWPGWSPLHAAIEELESGGSIEALVLLLRSGATVDMWDNRHDSTPLLMAVFRGQREAVRMLLAAGADPNVVGSEGDTPLRWSVQHDDPETVRLLLRCGANATIDSVGEPGGMTALGLAAGRPNVAIMKMLLDAGADPHVFDADHRYAIERLPPKETVDPSTWEEAHALLARRLAGSSEKVGRSDE
jgi:ankyrin repeat protein